jgi:hypothetical protein
MHCEIHNANHGWPDGDNRFYVGRSKKKDSPLGNPYIVGKDGDRQTVMAKYRRWLWEEIKKGNKSAAYRELITIAEHYRYSSEWEPVKLICWCAPLPCHAEIIKSAMDWLIKNNQLPKQN